LTLHFIPKLFQNKRKKNLVVSPVMGSQNEEYRNLSKISHFTEEEIQSLNEKFSKVSDENHEIKKSQFMEIMTCHVESFSNKSKQLFLQRLFDAFDENHNDSIDFREFIKGLSIILKGNTDEKMELSFKIYDIHHKGYLTRRELEDFTSYMYKTLYPDDAEGEQKMKDMVKNLFEDLDVDGNEQLEISEFKLGALKEPIIVDFLFLFSFFFI
jgi:Ca2+-binding EF-hand superfamily protein